MTEAGPGMGAPAPEVALSVIIPAYNEARRLPPHANGLLAYLRAHYPAFELIVVDDGSRDDTAAMVRTALAGEPRARLLAYQPNRGKGYADMSTPIEEIPAALERLAQADIVIGSRDLPSSDIRANQPLFRQVASELFKWVRYLMVGLWDISDTQCGFKAYRGPVARQLFALAQVDRFMFDVEILYLAKRAGLRIVEMPVLWSDSPGSKVRFWEGLVNMIQDLWRIRWQHRQRPVIVQ
jgi:dolichyl-phosphate beta-glucosyltransferase